MRYAEQMSLSAVPNLAGLSRLPGAEVATQGHGVSTIKRENSSG
jgi:hypothetical protein